MCSMFFFYFCFFVFIFRYVEVARGFVLYVGETAVYLRGRKCTVMGDKGEEG